MNEEQKILAEILHDELYHLLKYKVEEMRVLKINYVHLNLGFGKSVTFSASDELTKRVREMAEHLHSGNTYEQEKHNETDTH